MSNVIDWAKAHPRLSAWMLLAVGMVAIITYEARDVGLLWGQWAAWWALQRCMHDSPL